MLVCDWNPASGDYARKINWGFTQTKAEWVFQGADDVIFHPGWDMEALRAAQGGKRVIGTNDLHNPSVKRGKHSTHSLIARSYVEERPATVDESDPVMWEGYDHQYVDLELIEVAKRRNEFVFAQNAIVEHFHPHWGNATTDPTYKKAFRRTVADRMLYAQRLGIKRASTRQQVKRDRAGAIYCLRCCQRRLSRVRLYEIILWQRDKIEARDATIRVLRELWTGLISSTPATCGI